MLLNFNLPQPPCHVFVDAAIRAEAGRCGLAVIVRDERGGVVQWLGAITGPQTNNEAEYAAAILALRHLQKDRRRSIVVFSDSQVLVHQMQGRATARAPELQKKQMELRRLAAGYRSVRFEHIAREHNRLADALANEVADGESPTGARYA